MKVFSSSQFRTWDHYSMARHGIPSIELMERAAMQVFEWINLHFESQQNFYIFCGKGNNGGDGLALARMLIVAGKNVQIFILETGSQGSEDFTANLQKLHDYNPSIVFCQHQQSFPIPDHGIMLIDALFGTGLNKPLYGLALELVQHLQQFKGITIAIDLPSGLFADQESEKNKVLPATYTLSFQAYKLALLIDDNGPLTGEVHILDIGLSGIFEQETDTAFETIDAQLIKMIVLPRNPFGHKGKFGHACLVAGKQGMMGAAVLAARGCLASGAGKTTLFIPASQFPILQISVPEVICEISGNEGFEMPLPLQPYQAIGIGPGIGTDLKTREALLNSISGMDKPLLLDADALNCLQTADINSKLLSNCVITPHPLEFDRLFGTGENGFNRFERARIISAQTGVYIVLKGHHTCIFTPKGKVYINTNGNDGMAKGGAGDVLSGFITGLLAQGYLLPEAAIAGVFLHGLSGDIAAEKYSRHSMQPTQIASCFAEAWKKFE